MNTINLNVEGDIIFRDLMTLIEAKYMMNGGDFDEVNHHNHINKIENK